MHKANNHIQRLQMIRRSLIERRRAISKEFNPSTAGADVIEHIIETQSMIETLDHAIKDEQNAQAVIKTWRAAI